ncbi:hypothetical protein [Novispirillum itersonii]|uniref:Uncharacterized protein n=1 Tax=Novispirillum itersonii TaxID=189 RepID=A0A7W9ZGA4_NOVIT|nr:hypothetical protein [Novispirillum itersonii]MBB6210523.1 hypothetical protein [Novispirillum itersonii]
MRFLPYLLAVFMIAPMGIWIALESMLGGKSTSFAGETQQQVYTLLPIALIAIFLLAFWMSRVIARTQGRAS